MNILAIRSVNLASSTATAWKGAGVQFARRGRSTWDILQLNYNNYLNLGKSSFSPTDEQLEEAYQPDTDAREVAPMIWNSGEDIRPLLWPGLTRQLLGDLMPPQPDMNSLPVDIWIKAPGAHGRGKYKKNVDRMLVLPKEWDWQQHITGQEYRVVTVGKRIVQDMKRHGTNDNRSYEWVAMGDTPLQVKRTARLAASRVPGRNVIAWDLVEQTDGQVFLFEGNSCPGVNTETAERIVVEMGRQYNECF